MTTDRNYDEYDEDGLPVRSDRPEPSGGIYSLPTVGDAFSRARQFYGETAPQEGDSTGVRVGKEVLRWAPVVGGATVGAAIGALVAL